MNLSEPCLALAPVFGLTLDCAIHVVLSLLWKQQPRLVGLAIAYFAGLILTTIISGWALVNLNPALIDALGASFLNFISYSALAYGYYNFVGLNFSSLRIRLLQEILLAEDGIARSDVERRYGTKEIVTRRLDRLTSSGHLIDANGRFYLGKPLLLFVARCNDFVRLIILGDKDCAFKIRDSKELDFPAKAQVASSNVEAA